MYTEARTPTLLFYCLARTCIGICIFISINAQFFLNNLVKTFILDEKHDKLNKKLNPPD